MREINGTYIAGHEVTITDTVYDSDGITPFDGSLYEVIGNGADITDTTSRVTFTGTIDSSGNFTATLTSAVTLDLGGKVIVFDIFLKSGPFQFCVASGYLTFVERITS